MKQQKNKKIKLKERRQHIFKCEEPDLQESAIFKKIVAYQRKLLVRHIFEISFPLSHMSLLLKAIDVLKIGK